jgi:glycosyltransferase involved in cell wall biosynthesis/protein-tyrosine-phosphatase
MTPAAPLTVDSRVAPAPAVSPLRICHVMSADLWAGAEVQLATTTAYMVEQPGVSVSAVLFNEGPLAERLEQLGVPVTIVDEHATSALGILRCLVRFFKEHDIDVVHTHRYKDSVLAAIAAKLAGVRHVVRTVHGLREPMSGWAALKFRLYEALDRLALLCCVDLVIAVSMRMADTLRASGYRPTSVTHIHNGVDLSAIDERIKKDPACTRRELGIEPDAIVVGTVGRLSAVKGHATLLRAARRILHRHPNATFLIVGSGPLDSELRAEAARLGIGDACVFAGARRDVHDLMAAIDVFVLPSLDEGIPMALLEAMALRIPVVATAVGGVPEVVQDGVTGILVPAADHEALADASLRLIADREWAHAVGARGRQLVEQRFTQERCGRALLTAYRSVALIPRIHTRRPGEGRSHTAGRSDASARPIGPLQLCGGLARGAAAYAARKVAHWGAKRAMKRLRRNPAPIAARARRARNVLMVCHGNVIRSPFAARIVKQAINGTGSLSVASAGLEAVAGRPAHPTAIELANARHIDLGGHAATRITPELVAKSDLILVMDIRQLVTVRKRYPEAGQRTFLLTCLAPNTPLEVADPVGRTDVMFHRCFEHITRATSPLIREFNNNIANHESQIANHK